MFRRKPPVPTGKIEACVAQLQDFKIRELEIITGTDNKKDALAAAVEFTLENMIRPEELELMAENEKKMKG